MEVVMKRLQSMNILLAAGTAAALLATQTVFARPDANSLREVDTVWVDANACTDGISDQLRERGFFVTSSARSADAILVVDVQDRSSRLNDSAQYKARLHGSEDQVLFTASGTEYARNYANLCKDIGESIAGSMEAMG
jgi:hypothetical protein